MTFAEAFRAAVAGHRVRREHWNARACITASAAGHLVCAPPIGRHWNGPWEASLDDVEGLDWVICDEDYQL